MSAKSTVVPAQIAALHRDRHGRPVPWFVAWVGRDPDFRVVRSGGIHDALLLGICWVCGQQLGAHKAFVIGPMCAVNRVSAEPPSHRDCAVYSATHCPFLTTPNMRRRESGLPEAATDPAGVMIKRNPGVTLVWVTKRYQIERVDDGVLFRLSDPTETLWYAEGREATHAEVMASIDSGLPLLREIAEQDGPKAVAELAVMHAAALTHVPAS